MIVMSISTSHFQSNLCTPKIEVVFERFSFFQRYVLQVQKGIKNVIIFDMWSLFRDGRITICDLNLNLRKCFL